MKVALIRQKYHSMGGAEKNMVILAQGLLKRGHDVSVFCREWDEQSKGGIKFNRIVVPAKPAFLKLLLFDCFVRKELRKSEWDITHSFEMMSSQDVYRASGGCARSWNMKLEEIRPGALGKLMVYMRFYRLVEQWLEKRAFKKGHYRKIIAISKRVKDEIMKCYGVPSRDVEVIYNGVDLKEYNPQNRNIFRDETRKIYNLGPDDFVVLFVGSGFERKGLGNLIKAIALVAGDKNIKLLVAGHGKRARYTRIAGKLKIMDNIVFAGKVADVKKLYAAADVFVLPSVYEPFGTACLESLAAGLPTIVSEACGASEIITDNADGLIVRDCQNTEEIAEKIKMTFNNEFRKELEGKSRLLAEKYTVDKYVEKTIAVYTAAVK